LDFISSPLVCFGIFKHFFSLENYFTGDYESSLGNSLVIFCYPSKFTLEVEVCFPFLPKQTPAISPFSVAALPSHNFFIEFVADFGIVKNY